MFAEGRDHPLVYSPSYLILSSDPSRQREREISPPIPLAAFTLRPTYRYLILSSEASRQRRTHPLTAARGEAPRCSCIRRVNVILTAEVSDFETPLRLFSNLN